MLRWREALSRTRAMSAADAAGCRPFSCCIPLRSCYSPRARGRNLPGVDTLAARLHYSPRVRARAERSGCYVFLRSCYYLSRACAMCKANRATRMRQPRARAYWSRNSVLHHAKGVPRARARTAPGTQLCIESERRARVLVAQCQAAALVLPLRCQSRRQCRMPGPHNNNRDGL